MPASFHPLVSQNAKVLILGSMPGGRSLELQQYYAHPRNAFWYIMGEICGAEPELPYTERVAKLTAAGIALWDVLQHCEREGSLDSSIVRETETPNDFASFLAEYPHIRAILFNGQKAENSFRKLVQPRLVPVLLPKIVLKRLPSTSPTHSIKLAEKVQAWRAIEVFLSIQ
jgi:TDG/mug DNA glycosylase family protein